MSGREPAAALGGPRLPDTATPDEPRHAGTPVAPAPESPRAPEAPTRSAARRRRRRGGRVVGAAVAVAAVAAGVAAGLGVDPDLVGGRDTPGDAGPGGLPPADAPVSRQTLVDTKSEPGELGYGDAASVATKLTGTVTGLTAPGALVDRGKALFRVDDTPVVLLYGPLPAYRALAPDTKGADVRQFEQNLWALGYRGFTVDDTYTSATATAVRKWQKALGLDQTGTVELGRVVYTPDRVRVDELKAAPGDTAQPGTELLTYTGVTRVVAVELDMADQRLAVQGAPVTVRLPDGREIPGTITGATTVTDPGEGEGEAADPETRLRVTVAVDDGAALAALDQATVSVAFTASRREGVLTVPVAALLALAEGGYGVQVVDGTTTRIVPVRTGMFANGRVEVSGDGIAEGTIVGMPS